MVITQKNKFFVGKLLTKDGDGNSGYSSDVFIESVGADFYVSQSEIENAEVKVSPRGEFYYHCGYRQVLCANSFTNLAELRLHRAGNLPLITQ